MNAPNTCFIPLVAGSLLNDLPSIFRKIDSLGQEMQKIPYAIFVLGDRTSMEPDINKHHMSPAVVSIVSREKDAHFYYNFTHVTIKAKIGGSPNTIFNFQCPGTSSHHHTLLLYKDGQVNRQIAEVCKDRFVRVAFNQDHGLIEVNTENNTMIEYPSKPGEYAHQWEILSSFFANKRLTPIFTDCNFTWGWLDEDTGLWNSAVAMVDSLCLFFI